MIKSQDFLKLLQNPQVVNAESARSISEIIKEFPYFQSARALYLKSLKNSESSTYNHQLKSTAAYTTDRSILFDFIVSEEFNQNEISKSIQSNSEQLKSMVVEDVEDISVNRSVTIDDALKQSIEETDGVLDPDLFKEKIDIQKVANFAEEDSTQENEAEQDVVSESEKTIVTDEVTSTKNTAEEILEIGKPLEFKKDEVRSFAEWLNLTKAKPIDRDVETNNEIKSAEVVLPSKEEQEQEENKTEKRAIIDKFLDKNPKILPSKEYTPKPLLYRNEINHEGLMTETLARIYLEQKNYEKAIQSYKILSLKYPEKSSFFADQIQAVKELQENNTTK
ncbi:hypothetical protein SAMN03097699_1935 [Flavobacteriaceae bacterium MAR_2010_188]|nr:hypothetical protein SAMN03097699_1935 [Flavobacteriaceae bacterium MAR_2010_188]